MNPEAEAMVTWAVPSQGDVTFKGWTPNMLVFRKCGFPWNSTKERPNFES